MIDGKRRHGGYSYVYVHQTVPQSLNLWHNGHTILSSPGNTGVPAAPTQLGTFPVFEHIPIGTMSGTNPDGSHYNDPVRADKAGDLGFRIEVARGWPSSGARTRRRRPGRASTRAESAPR